ncbi:hypothetical protein HOY82DRAFT_602363 [Tuber indicum]|nr:hypothetical protein HOY82DRAFT_602363 [Tuber indicum]
MVTVRCTASTQAGNVEESNQETKAKPVPKKRKTLCQELPIPTTNLPPRKRAKTDEEKEERRVERVLRNRAAEQSSRERKRNVVESLETERARLSESNTDLRAQLLVQEAGNSAFSRELEAMKEKLKQYEKYLNVESREAPELSTNEDDNLFQFLLSDAAAAVSATDPSVFEWRGALHLSEPMIAVDCHS